MKFQAIKGVRDILPPESALWNRVEQSARNIFATYGFGEIRLPIFEATELFARSIGVDTDVVSKEMYTFEDREDDELAALRTLLLKSRPSINDSDYFLSYELKVAEFQERLRRGIESGRVPRTPQNEKALNDLSHLLDRLASLRQKHEETKDPADRKPFDLYIQHVRNYLQAVETTDSATAPSEPTDLGLARVKALLVELGEDVTLRPEATASVVRAYIEHGMQTQPGNVKLYYIGPMFRRERPQKGRYRQFYQIGAEVLGPSDAPSIDAELIEMLMAFFERVKLTGATLYINSIGDKSCRPAYVERLRAELQKVREQLGADSQRRVETNPLRVLDSKVESEQAIIAKLPRIGDHLCAECRAHYDEVKRQLALRGIAYQENWRLVRGLDYYMRTTFEITAPGLGSQNAVCGGGRYDGLVELLGGPAATKGIGFAIGTDRLILSLLESGADEAPGGLDAYLAWFGAAAQSAAIKLARRLREEGFSVEVPATEMKFGKALSLADRLKARDAIIIGEDEIAAGVFTVKRLADGAQQKLVEPALLEYLRAARSAGN